MNVDRVSPGSVHGAIALASSRTGVDFNYLLGQAHVESGMRADARAGTSSARGLYQFIEGSWLSVVKRHGAEHGLGWAADAIGPGNRVADPATRQAILQLRNDPQAASLMAAAHAADNAAALEGTLGRPANGTDLYMAHFLGLGGAKTFLSAMAASPERSGASLFPSAARANRAVFFGPGGQPRSLSEIYGRFADKLDRGAAAQGASGAASGGGAGDAGAMLAALEAGGEVVLGNGAQGGDQAWLASTLANLNVVRPGAEGAGTAAANASLYRPTPASARLAYMMLANLGA